MEKEPEDSLNQVFIQNNEDDDDDDDGNVVDAPFNLDDVLGGNNVISIDKPTKKEETSPKKV